MIRLFSIYLIIFLVVSCNNNENNTISKNKINNSIPIIAFETLNYYPHDTTSFTEGLLFHNGELYESTGATSDLPQTKSLFGIVDLKNGKIDTKVELDGKKYFGEGITFLNGKVYQLTYKNKVGFIYDTNTFKKLGYFIFPSKEGWGLTTDGTNLIMSDGTNLLTYLDPNSLQVIKTISVSENGYAKDFLNELEYINGFIYANIWTTNTIVKINPSNGKIVGIIDLTSLAHEAKNIFSGSLEMNGVAYDSIEDKILVTGKLWPKIFEIRFRY